MNTKLSAISSVHDTRAGGQRSAGFVVILSGAKNLCCPALAQRQRPFDRLRVTTWGVAAAAWLFSQTAAFAANVPTTIDSGGQRTTSANYTMDGSIGGIGGSSSAGSQTTRHGYPGQLTDVTSVSVTGVPAQVNETSTSQLSGTATLDDTTVAMLTGSDLTWNVPAWPIAGINGSGVATASVVYANTAGTVSGSYLGVNGSGQLLVLDSLPDNFGSYAGDGLPDWWQNQYFGLDNPNAAPDVEVDGDGQNNVFEYTAGTDPTNSVSAFLLRIENVAGQADQKKLTFLPLASGRTYAPEFRTNLTFGAYADLTGYSGPTTNGTDITVTDLNATEQSKFYRIRITYP